LSDADGILATPLVTLRRDLSSEGSQVPEDVAALVRLVDVHEIVEVVVGLPVTLAGTEGFSAAHVRSYAQGVGRRLVAPVPVAVGRREDVDGGGRP